MSRVQIALAAALAVLVVAIALVLSSAPLVVLASNGLATNATLAVTNSRSEACQAGERIPRGTKAIRLSLGAFNGPATAVRVFAGAHVVASGTQGSDWAGSTVTVPIGPVAGTVYPVTVCFASALVRGEVLRVDGSETNPTVAARSAEGEVLPGRVQIAYLGSGRSSVVTHMGLGREPSGSWVAFVVLLLMLVVAALSARLVLGETDG
jgi:hypothetical protein